MNLSKSIRVGLAMKNMGQGDLAEATGIHPSNVSKMVNGKMAITTERLSEICTALGMKVSDFIRLGEEVETLSKYSHFTDQQRWVEYGRLRREWEATNGLSDQDAYNAYVLRITRDLGL